MCAYGRSEGTREKVVPFSAAGHHPVGFVPAHMKKAAHTYMFASVLLRGRGIFNSHFNIFSDCHLARSSHLQYVTCAQHIYRLPWQYPRSLFPPSVPTPPRAVFRHKSHSWPWPGASAARVGVGAPHPPRCLPDTPHLIPPHPTPPQPAVSPSPLSPLYGGKGVG